MQPARLHPVAPADLAHVQGGGLTPAVSLTPVANPVAALDWSAVRPQPDPWRITVVIAPH